MAINFHTVTHQICKVLKKFPKNLDGKTCILEMKKNNSNKWRQMEWIGFYLEYWCNENLKKIMQMPCPKKYGRVSFDGYLDFPWDFKCHVIEAGDKIIVNDSEAISNAVKEHGFIGIILVIGNATYDNVGQEFKKWHDKLKGDRTEFVIKRINRGAISRKRKISLSVSKILFIKIDQNLLSECDAFQKNFRNANGMPRRNKVLLDLSKIQNNTEYIIEY